ncbi:MAG TPA: secretin N-terminal domain-containing protein [Pirellulaceae bacterium]|nr:secretin N-terminal domain-containing protein [Pirellulaceae bacterium]
MPARCTLLLTYVLVSQAVVLAARGQEEVDYTALAEPAFANRLALTDDQRAAIAKQLDERVQKLVAAKPDERPKVLAESNQKLEQLLSDEQRAAFAALVAGGKLRFNFRQQKWPDVLDWFARQSDLSLVMDTAPPGMFTYSDTKEYSPSEAVDLLNSVLLSKGFTLMRREKMLIVVDTSEGIPFEMAPRVSVEELADRGRFEIATVEFALAGRPIDTCLALVKELIGKHGRATPLTAAGKLIVTETAGKLQAINEVISAVPVPKPPPEPQPKPPAPIFAVYPAKGLDPEATVDTLQGLFNAATIKADPTAEEIHAYAAPATHEGIKTSLEKMTANVSGDKRARLEIYAVDIKDLTQLQSQLELAVPKAQVTADEAQQRLLVVANAEQQTEVQQTLEKLGAASEETASKATVTVYQVEAEATDGLVTLLQQILPRGLVISQPGRIAVRATPDEQKLAQTTIDQFEQSKRKPELPSLKFYPLNGPLDPALLSAVQTTVPDATVTLLDDGKRLSVLAIAEDQSLIAATLQQIEADLPQPAKRSLEIYNPEQISAAELQTLLGSVVPDAQINVGPSGERLIVWATETEHESISATLQKVGDEPRPEEPSLATYEVPESEASAILTAVQSLAPKAQASLDSTSRHLIVIGAAADQQLIGELVEKLAPAGDDPQKVLIAYPLAQGDPAAVVEMLQELRPDVRFAADKRANRILVTAPLREQPRLQAVIEQLDAAPDTSQEEVVKPYRLNTLNPAIVVELLQPIFPEMRLSVSEESKQLLAAGTEFDHKKLEQTVERIGGEDAATAQVQSYDIGTSDSDQVRNVLLQLVPEAVVSSNPEAQRLMVWADEAGHGAIKQAIDQFTRQEPDQTRQLRTYPLPKAISSAALTMLQPVAPDALLSLDDSGQQIIAWATAQQQQAVQQAIEELRQNLPQREDVSLRVHQATADVLRNANPLLTDVAPRARLVEAADSDKWLVWATASEHQAVAELLETLTEQVDTKRSARSIKAYPLARTDASVARQMITDQAENATILDSSDTRRLIVLGTADEHTKIEAVLAELATVLKQPDTSLRVYPIEDRRLAAQTIVDSLDAEVSEGVSIQVNVDANSLIVRASEASHARLKQAISALVEQLPPAPSLNTQVFRFSHGSPTAALPVLQSLVPTASIAADDVAGTLAATASEADLARIKTVVEQMQATEPDANFVTQIYRFNKVSAETARSTFLQLAPGASVASDSGANILIASAPEKAHQVFRDAAAQLDGPPTGSTVRVYPLDANQITAAEVAAAMDDALKNSVAIQVNETVNSLIVRGSEEAQQEIRLAIDAIVEQLPAAPAKTTKVYPLKLASAEVVQEAVASLVESGSVVGDEASGSLLVTGTDADHKRVADVIEKLDVVPSQQPVMRAYPIRHADPKAVYQTVSQAYERSRDVSVTYQPTTRSMFVVATLRHQAVFKELIAELDQPGPPRQPQYAKVYSLANVDGDVAASALNTLFQKQDVEIQFNPTGNALVVVATTSQHKSVEESLKQMEGIERALEVFALQNTDPFVVENAVYDLFVDAPEGAAPSVSSDYDSQRLFVRGTKPQIEQIRKLLVSLGEPVEDTREARQSGDVRTIPFRGDTREAVRQIESIWARLRPNRIQVITPSQRNLIPQQLRKMPKKPGEQDGNPADSEKNGTNKSSAVQTPSRFHFVAIQQTTRKEAPEQADADKKPVDKKPVEQEAKASSKDEPEKPPIVVLPEEGRITIASPDHEALDQLESLLRAMARSDAGTNAHPNLAIFMLQNTGASEMQLLLTQLFDELPMGRGSMGKVVVMADERLNALIVHGSRKDREIVEELMRVLDTSELPDPLSVSRPELIGIRNTQAQRVLAILENVYKTQLTSGGGRRPVQIPKGVSSAVASVLQQINAAATGPLLTLDVDETTNSIIMRAPPELREEIKAFVEQLDGQASERSNRGIRVIRLQNSKADRMQAVLQQFILESK